MRSFTAIRGRAATLLPWVVPVLALVLVLAYGANVPIGDQWTLSEMFARDVEGTLTFSSLLSQLNETRAFFPRLLFLGLTRFGYWNPRVEMMCTQLLLGATAYGLARLWRQTRAVDVAPARGGARDDGDAGTLLAAFLVLYSLVQHENFFWGIQFICFVPGACLVACLLIARAPRSFGRVIAWTMVLCTIATFSYANGLLCWPLAAVAIVWLRDSSARRPASLWLVWIAGALMNVWIYFHDYVTPAGHPGFSVALRTPVDAALAYCTYLGSSLSFGPDRAWIAVFAGVGVLALLAACAGYFLRHPVLTPRARPWLILAAYALGSGALTTAGRLGFGREYMLATRYVTFSVPAIVALLFLVRLCVDDWTRRRAPVDVLAADRAGIVITCVIGVISLVASVETLETVRGISAARHRTQAVVQFAAVAPAPIIKDQFGWAAGMMPERILTLQRGGYLPTPRDIMWETTPAPVGCVDGRRREEDGSWTVSGWTLRPDDAPADVVLVTRGAMPAEGLVTLAVPDTLRLAHHLTPVPRAGWRLSLDGNTPLRDLQFWAVYASARRAYRLCEAVPPG